MAGVKLQLPLASAVVVPTERAVHDDVTVLPASAVPVYVGVLSLVREPLAGVTTTGAAGAVVSTMNVLVLLGRWCCPRRPSPSRSPCASRPPAEWPA